MAHQRSNDSVPVGRTRHRAFASQIRAQQITQDGTEFVEVTGYASVTEHAYRMWDQFGEYSEVVSRGAFDATLSQSPDVVFLENHTGRAMARTGAGTLELRTDETGLLARAMLNPKRSDVADLLTAVNDKAVSEMSFAFTIDRGAWTDDFSQYRIDQVNLDRGDVSAVTYGANPATSIEARTSSLMSAIDSMTDDQARAALARVQARIGHEPATASLALARAQLLMQDD